MSRLEAILYGLCEVVIEYCAAQTKKKTASLEDLLEKPDEEFIEALEHIIAPLILNTQTRSSLLEYLVSEIGVLKPLIDKRPINHGLSPMQNEALWTAPQTHVLRAHLTQLIDILSKLLPLSANESIRVVVSNKEWHIYGLKPTTMHMGSARAAKLIKNKVIAVLGMPWAAKEYVSGTIHQYVNTLMSDHCNALMNPLLASQNHALKTEYQQLISEKNTSFQTYEQLQNDYQLLKKETTLLKGMHADDQAQLKHLTTELKFFKDKLDEKERKPQPAGISIATQTKLNRKHTAVQTEVLIDDVQAETDAIQTLTPNHEPLSQYYRHPFSQSLANFFALFPLYKSHAKAAEDSVFEPAKPH
ncbi:MAG: hypothetical protein H2069_07275 [Legionella sp.]|nr:hypothetical protein [Legionella sp.]